MPITKLFVPDIAIQLSGPHLQEIALRMAEAVVKFELLSTDPKATVRKEPLGFNSYVPVLILTFYCLG